MALAEVKADGRIILPIGYGTDYKGDRSCHTYGMPVTDYKIELPYGEPRINPAYGETYFDTVQTSEKLVAYEQSRISYISVKKTTLEKEIEPLVTQYKKEQAAKKAEIEAKEASIKAEREAKAASEKAIREALEAEKLAWILEHGSNYLKDAASLDYDCQRLYAIERSSLEYPDFTLDFDDKADWSSRSCPSAKAIAIVKSLVAFGIDAQVVWLTSPVDGEESDEFDDEESGFDAREAIVIRDYLGKYDLVKIVG